MSILNRRGTASTTSTRHGGISYNGNPQDIKNSAQQLYEIIVMTLYGKDEYYESTDVRVKRLELLINEVAKNNGLDFVANAIIHARTAMNIRSMPLILTVLFAKALREQNKQYPHMRQVVCDVIQRADQITDMYAVALGYFKDKKVIPMAIKRGVADAFNKFNEYNLAKYNRDGKIKMRDILRIVHPTAINAEQGVLFEKIMKDTLEAPYTWEVELSKNGQLPEAERKTKAQLWGELITSKKLGYMALLRNLRNIKEAGVSAEVMSTVYTRLADPEQVAKSKQLPFRFISAYDNVQQFSDSKLQTALSKAVDASLSGLPRLGEHVWIIIDCSGSMGGGYYGSFNGANAPIRTAALFAAALTKANAEAKNIKVTMFSDSAFNVGVDTISSVLSITEKFMSKVVGGGTNLQGALDLKNGLGFEPDTVIVLSDMQVDMLRSRKSTNIFDKDCLKIAINLNAYNTTPVSELDGWYQLSGWSERLFDFIPALRNKTSVVKTLSVPYAGVEGVKVVTEE